MQPSWRKKRQKFILYIAIFIVIIFTVYKSYPYIFPAPSCNDNKQNGDEEGIDCGGSCSLICKSKIIPLEIKYTRYVKTEDGLYDIVAMIENKNKNITTFDSIMDYSFSIYDKAGKIIQNIVSSTSVPVGQSFPIIIQNIPLNIENSGNGISNISLSLSDGNKQWINVSDNYRNTFFKVASKNFENNKNNISVLTISLENTTRAYFRNVPIRVILSDKNGNVVALNESLLKEINSKETKDITFTWRIPLNIQDPKIDVYPIVTPNTYIK